VLHVILKKSRERLREEGFSLIEILLGIVVIGILTAIVVPMYLNAKAESDSATVKTALQSAAILVEQEAVDNNGLYPTYFPNEIKSNPKMQKFVYSYSDSRTNFCIQAPSAVGKLFVSANNKEVSSTPCVESNIADGGDLPWQPPVVTNPIAPSVVNTWASNATTSVSAIQMSAVSCTLDEDDRAQFDSKKSLEYRVKVSNLSRSGEFYYTSWDAARSITTPLTGWLPNEQVTYEAQARCLISIGTDFSYPSQLSTATLKNVAVFVVTPANFVATTASWTSNTNFRANASWNDAFCPAGVKQSLLSVVDTKTGSAMPFSSTWAAWRTSLTYDVSTWSSGGTTRFSHTVGCLLPNGTRISSVAKIADVNTALRPPVAPTGLSSNNAQGSTLVIPNNVLWSAVTCATGTPEYKLQQYAPSGTVDSGWIGDLNQAQEHLAGTTYSWRVQARCVDGAAASIASAMSDLHSYTAQYSRAPAPLSAPVPDKSVPYLVNTTAVFTLNSNTCPTGTTATQYRLYANGELVTYQNDNNKVSVSVGSSPGSDRYTYSLICNINGFVTTESAQSPAATISVITKPAAPNNFTSVRIYILSNYFSWSSVSGASYYELNYNGSTTRINNNGAATYTATAQGTVRNQGFRNANKTNQPGLEAMPQASVRAVDAYGNVGAWNTMSVDTPRMRLFSSVHNGFLPMQTYSNDTRSSNSIVGVDGEYFTIIQTDRNLVRYNKAFVAQNASSYTLGGRQIVDHWVYNQDGAFAWYSRGNGTWDLQYVQVSDSDMMVQEAASSGQKIRIYKWNGSGFTLKSEF
jgi:prepilin-type N-terminal cleavage/methylation domain-containing protein